MLQGGTTPVLRMLQQPAKVTYPAALLGTEALLQRGRKSC